MLVMKVHMCQQMLAWTVCIMHNDRDSDTMPTINVLQDDPAQNNDEEAASPPQQQPKQQQCQHKHSSKQDTTELAIRIAQATKELQHLGLLRHSRKRRGDFARKLIHPCNV